MLVHCSAKEDEDEEEELDDVETLEEEDEGSTQVFVVKLHCSPLSQSLSFVHSTSMQVLSSVSHTSFSSQSESAIQQLAFGYARQSPPAHLLVVQTLPSSQDESVVHTSDEEEDEERTEELEENELEEDKLTGSQDPEAGLRV
jgi:hypothetical protein